VEILLRMYLRWGEKKGFNPEIIDILTGKRRASKCDLHGHRSYAYGYLKAESGIHRLVRISPLTRSQKAYIFRLCFCLPRFRRISRLRLTKRSKVDTYRASGAEGNMSTRPIPPCGSPT
jgi:peptide chain release factor 2